MQCVRCGFNNVDGGNFCKNCGDELGHQPPPIQKAGTSTTLKILLGLACGFCIVTSILSVIGPKKDQAPGPSASAAAEKTPEPPPKPKPEIRPLVQFDGRQFIIANTDSFDWTNVKLELMVVCSHVDMN